MDSNQRTYEQFAYEYTEYQLWPPERLILERFKSEWHRIRLLDLGVGGGRTAYTFAAVAKEYVGVDYATAMIDKCKTAFEESPHLSFHVADARHLSGFADDSFDFVLFCWNGIDAVSHEDRKKVFAEVRRVLRKYGHFFFSTHTVYDFPFRTELPSFNSRAPLSSLYQWIRSAFAALKIKWRYRNIDANTIRKQPYAILSPPDHEFGLQVHYIQPEYQLKQLEEAGFETLTAYDRFGRIVDPKTTRHPGYLYFLCKPARQS